MLSPHKWAVAKFCVKLPSCLLAIMLRRPRVSLLNFPHPQVLAHSQGAAARPRARRALRAAAAAAGRRPGSGRPALRRGRVRAPARGRGRGRLRGARARPEELRHRGLPPEPAVYGRVRSCGRCFEHAHTAQVPQGRRVCGRDVSGFPWTYPFLFHCFFL
jgi:hypothetical protein